MVESSSISITPSEHAANHVVGGTDPLVNPLVAHASRHEPGGADVISGFWVTAGGEVFSGTPTGSSQTLDISSAVGAVPALVILKIHSASATRAYRFKPNVGAAPDAAVDFAPCDSYVGASPDIGYALCLTNTVGELKFDTTGSGTVKIDVVKYLLL